MLKMSCRDESDT